MIPLPKVSLKSHRVGLKNICQTLTTKNSPRSETNTSKKNLKTTTSNSPDFTYSLTRPAYQWGVFVSSVMPIAAIAVVKFSNTEAKSNKVNRRPDGEEA